MPLVAGTRLGPYEIVAPLGSGGMDEVYRAHDPRLGRDVAIKVLTAAFAADRRRLRRFEQEARALAALIHPNIVTIHSVEEADGLRFLTMELVEGQPLSLLIQPGGVPLDRLLEVAIPLADALAAPHGKGITHRDLKPANIIVGADRRVKILDFGLAKLHESSPAAATVTAVSCEDLTGEGRILGTVVYMSPEQAEGKPIDHRSDLFSLGVIVYEMATGRRPFTGETSVSILSSILKDTPPSITELKATLPSELGRIIRHALIKDPERRYQTAKDLRNDLDELKQSIESGELAGGSAIVKRRFSARLERAVGLIVLGLLVLAGGAGLFYLARPSAPVTSPSEYTQITNFTDSAVAPSLSPDGQMVTFIRGGESFFSRGQIYVKLLPNGESVQLTNDAQFKYGPVFTPDGSRIAYTVTSPPHWDTGTVPVLGGPPTRLLPNASGLTWIADHRVLFSEITPGGGFHMGIVTATEGRADSRQIYMHPNENAMAHYSYASPDRQWLLVVEMIGAYAFSQPCRLVPFDGSSPGRQVGPRDACTSAAWSPDGRWMYFGAAVGGSLHLWRQKFPNGAPEQITFGPLEEEGIAVAPDGRSLVTSVGMRRSAIWIHDATGERAISSEGYAAAPRLSRDVTRVFYLLVRDWMLAVPGWVPSSAELRSVDLASGKSDRVLLGVSATDYDISRDEKEVAFTKADNSGEPQIWLASLDRSTPPRRIARGDQVSFGADETLIFRSLEEKANVLVRIKKDGSGRERITNAPILDKFGVSPDGEWVIVQTPGSVVDPVFH